jgi:SSS family solute:Na+ symporter
VPILAATDSLILLLYFFFVLAVGVSLKPLLTTSLDFLQAGRALPAWICGLAMTAASLGSQEAIGMGAAGAHCGFASIPFYLLGAIPAMLFAGLYLMPVYYGSRARTLPEFLGFRFDKKTRVLNACLFAAMAVFGAGISLYATARIFAALHVFEAPLRAAGLGPEAVMILSMAVPAALVLACILLGGLTGTIYTLVIQFFVIVAGLLPVVFLGLKQIGGWSGLKAAASLSTFAQSSHAAGHSAIAGFALAAALGLMVSAGTWCADFRVLQAPMAAKDLMSARMAPLIAAAVRIVVPLLLILPAIVALALPTPHTTIVIHNDNGAIYHDITVVPPEVENGQGLVPAMVDAPTGKPVKDAQGRTMFDYAMAAPNVLLHFLPTGLLGLGLAALLASMMAGTASSLMAFSTVFACDLYEPLLCRNSPDEKSIAVVRWAAVGGMSLAFGVACLAMRFDSLFDAMVLVFAVVNSPLLAALLLGAFWKRATGCGAFSGLIAGAAAALLHHGLALPQGAQRGIRGGWIAVLHHPSSELHFSIGTSVLAFLVSLIVTALVSLFTKARPEAELAGLVHSLLAQEPASATWWKRPEAFAIAILLAAIAVCAVFI